MGVNGFQQLRIECSWVEEKVGKMVIDIISDKPWGKYICDALCMTEIKSGKGL